jgi:hypothetical protein
MAIKKYLCDNNCTISNMFKDNLLQSASLSNTSLADSLEASRIYAQTHASSSEVARFLLDFPITTITSDRTAGTIPASGSVSFYLQIGNQRHPYTLPRQMTLKVHPLSRSFGSGNGVDLSNWTDLDAPNWISASDGTAWTTEGGDFFSNVTASQHFENGDENLDVDITPIVESWIAGDSASNGLIIKLEASQETGTTTYYTKRFAARGSEFFFNRPYITALWDNARKDDRGRFYQSSSVATAAENLNQIFFYNYVRGQLRDLPGKGQGSLVYVTLHTSASAGTQIITQPSTPITGGWAATGIYSASVACSASYDLLYDRWFSGSTYYFTGSLRVKTFGSDARWDPTPTYVTTCTNLKQWYSNNETAHFRFWTRKRNWSPNVYTKLQQTPVPDIVEDAYYQIKRLADDKIVIGYGTGSLNHTRLSYDVSGSHFTMDMSMLEKGYAYQINLAFYENGAYHEQDQNWRFRVEE